MGTIRVHTVNERIVIDNKPIITSGNKNINDISVIFCDKWLSLGEDTEFWAVFFKDEKTIYKRKLENGYCLIPNAVISKKGWFYFGFYANTKDGEKVKTSKIAEYEVTQGVPTEETASGDENTDSGNTGGSSSGNTNIDLTNYVTKDMLPIINIDDIFEKIDGSVNLYQPTAEGWIDNTYILLSGETTASDNFSVSPKIPVAPNTTYSIKSHFYGECHCYDSDDNYIGYSSFKYERGDVEYTYGTTKENTAYIRINVPNGEREDFNTNFMLVEGVGVSPFEYRLKALIREIGDLSQIDIEDVSNLVSAINSLNRLDTNDLITPSLKNEIAVMSAQIVDDALSDILGSGVVE